MKYIRTKYGKLYDLEELNVPFMIVDDYIDFNLGGRGKIIKQADTIEELCDEFVFEDSDGHYLCNFCEQTDLDVGSKFDELKYWFNYSKKQQYKIRNCYGAIWTDKSLIYVAKMNDKGELELI